MYILFIYRKFINKMLGKFLLIKGLLVSSIKITTKYHLMKLIYSVPIETL